MKHLILLFLVVDLLVGRDEADSRDLGTFPENSQVQDLNRDIREECRSKIAGYYFELLNQVESHSGFVVSLKGKISTIKIGLDGASDLLSKFKKVRDASGYDLELERKVRNQLDLVNLLKKRLSEDTAALKSYQQKLDFATKAEKRFKSKILHVFDIKKDERVAGYKMKILFKHSCHEFEFLCPLPKQQASMLRTMMGAETPESCRRYSLMIPISRGD